VDLEAAYPVVVADKLVNLRIKSLVEECWSESCTVSGLVVCVSTHPVVSQRFPFLHGDETGTEAPAVLSFR